MAAQRPITRLLVANRGEIATRIISTARELEIETFAIYTSQDTSHTHGAAHAIQVSSPAFFLDIDGLILVIKKHVIDAVHPGYGFLSESPEFARRVWDEAGAMFIGPGWDILQQTGDKLQARLLAQNCSIPVLAALQEPTDDIEVLRHFAAKHGLPIVIKAVDGGGGRGIRIVHNEEDLPNLAKRALDESPSKKVFAEAAAIEGFRHIEVQIIGDGHNVKHLFERECSIQRRFQKVVEFAPSSIKDRELVASIIDAAVRMAKSVNYLSLGTFEFLVNPSKSTFYFLECNPRLQVEHTVTEGISLGCDLVKAQLLVAQGHPLSSLDLSNLPTNPRNPPPLQSLQLRVTAENPEADWSLSVGKITSFAFPTGHGIRTDTSMLPSQTTIVGTDFDSLLAKLIITSSTWEAAVAKARRALEDIKIEGIKTNISVLRGVLSHPDFLNQKCDTEWLEKSLPGVLRDGFALSKTINSRNTLIPSIEPSNIASNIASISSGILFRKGDAWTMSLSPQESAEAPVPKQAVQHSHLQISRILRNDFPTALSVKIIFTPPSSTPQPYILNLNATSSSSFSNTSSQRRGDPENPNHIITRFPGQLVEMLVDEDDWVKKGDTVAIIRQMKMELEIRADQSGLVVWVFEGEDGEEVGEGVLIAEIRGGPGVEAKL